jgi:hypothetical protein
MDSQTIPASIDKRQQASRTDRALEVVEVARPRISVATPKGSTAKSAQKPAVGSWIRVGNAALIGAVTGAMTGFVAAVLSHVMVPSFGPMLGMGGLFALEGALMAGGVGCTMDSIAAGLRPPAADEAHPG